MDAHCQRRRAAGAGAVADGVAEAVAERVAALAQRLHRRGVVVDAVAVAAVRIQRQGSVGAGGGAADHTGSGTADRADRHAVAGVGIGIVAQHVTRRVRSRRGIGGAAGLHRTRRVGGRERCVVAAVDGDGDGLVNVCALVIGDPRRVGLADRLACLERLRRHLGVVQRVGPDAGAGVERHRAVARARRALQAPGPRRADIDVARAECPRCRRRARQHRTRGIISGFRDTAGNRSGLAGQHRRVVRSDHVDRDGARRRRSPGVGHRRREALGRARTRLQCVDRRGLDRIAVGAVRVDRQVTVGPRVAAAPTQGLGRIHVRRRQRPRQVRIRVRCRRIRHRVGVRAAHQRGVVAAIEGNRQRLLDIGPLVVGHPRNVALRHHIAFTQRLCRGLRVVQRVGPDARAGVERHRAVARARRALQAPRLRCAGIDVARAECPRRRRRACHDSAVILIPRFRHAAGNRRRRVGHHRRVVAAGDGDRHGGRGSPALAVVDGVGEDLAARRMRVRPQGLYGRQGVVERVGEGAVAADVQTAVAAADTGTDGCVAQRRSMLVAGNHTLNGQNVMILVAVLARTAAAHHVAAHRADARRGESFQNRRRIVGGHRRMVHDNLDVGACRQLAARALVLRTRCRSGAAAVGDVGVLVVQGIAQRDAGVIRRRI